MYPKNVLESVLEETEGTLLPAPERPELFVYLSWQTSKNYPLLDTDQLRQAAYQAITARTRAQFCHILAIGGTARRVQLVCRFPASLPITTIQRIARQACAEAAARPWAASARTGREPSPLWERTYTARTVCRMDTAEARDYLRAQPQEAETAAREPAKN